MIKKSKKEKAIYKNIRKNVPWKRGEYIFLYVFGSYYRNDEKGL